MSESTQEWFVAERSRALAMIHLTRRDDLVITRASQEVGLDYLVSIRKRPGERALRQFGVFLRGSKSATTEEQLDELLRPLMQSLLRAGEFPYPVCLFHFTMDDDQGYVTWVAEPTVNEAGPRLLLHAEPHCCKLDRQALDEIVE